MITVNILGHVILDFSMYMCTHIHCIYTCILVSVCVFFFYTNGMMLYPFYISYDQFGDRTRHSISNV